MDDNFVNVKLTAKLLESFGASGVCVSEGVFLVCWCAGVCLCVRVFVSWVRLCLCVRARARARVCVRVYLLFSAPVRLCLCVCVFYMLF